MTNLNKDCVIDKRLVPPAQARDYYLSLLKNYKSPYPDPIVKVHNGVRVVRDDLIVGTKVRAADPFVWNSDADNFVYTQARNGLAGISLLDVTNRRKRYCTIFMPACKEISHHQACCIERGAFPIFERIAALNNLRRYAQDWAALHNAAFIPLGLDAPLATAGIIKAALTIEEPSVVYCAISTGVLCRALQIAWPNAKFVAVAVSRNIQYGEKGRADIIVEPLPFHTAEKPENRPPFPSVATYDAKVWKYIPRDKKGVLFWNVGADPVLNDETIIKRTKSNVVWRSKR